jgi:hypothetical protein
MTTICYKDGILAADTLIIAGESMSGTGIKILRINGDRYGVSGNFADVARLRAWNCNTPISEANISAKSNVLWVDKKGLLLEIERDTILPPIEAPYHAYGSGADYALGAMAMGASAAEAVIVAAKFDPFTNTDVTVLEDVPNDRC